MRPFFEAHPALKNRNFRIFIISQSISFIGTWLQITTQAWLVYQMTHSSFALGLTAFLGVAPVMVLMPLGGALVDRYPTRTVLRFTNAFGVVQAVVFGALYLSGTLHVWEIYVLAFAWGVASGFDSPARYTSVLEIVGAERTMQRSAQAINLFLINLGFIFGPGIAGLVIAKAGVGPSFFLNAASFIPFLVLLPKINFGERTRRIGQGWRAVPEGIVYSFRHATIRPLMIAMSLALFIGFSFRGLMPALAAGLQLGPTGYGWLSSAPGMGAMFVLFTLKPERARAERTIILGLAAISLALVAARLFQHVAADMLCFAVAGFGLDSIVLTVQNKTASIVLESDPHMLGRVISCCGSMFFIGNAFGNLSIGWTARHYGAFNAVGYYGVALLLVVGVLFAGKLAHRDLIPETEDALAAADRK